MVLTVTDASYEIQEFRDNPGMYFEKFGRLHYARETSTGWAICWFVFKSYDMATLE